MSCPCETRDIIAVSTHDITPSVTPYTKALLTGTTYGVFHATASVSFPKLGVFPCFERERATIRPAVFEEWPDSASVDTKLLLTGTTYGVQSGGLAARYNHLTGILQPCDTATADNNPWTVTGGPAVGWSAGLDAVLAAFTVEHLPAVAWEQNPEESHIYSVVAQPTVGWIESGRLGFAVQGDPKVLWDGFIGPGAVNWLVAASPKVKWLAPLAVILPSCITGDGIPSPSEGDGSTAVGGQNYVF